MLDVMYVTSDFLARHCNLYTLVESRTREYMVRKRTENGSSANHQPKNNVFYLKWAYHKEETKPI